MAETLYASFAEPSQAEKAAGALLDYGVLAEDLSLITRGSHTETYTTQTSTGERAAAGTAAAGNRTAEAGDRFAAGASRAAGADYTAANYEAAAERHEATATEEGRQAAGDYETTHESRHHDDTELAAKKGISTTTSKDAGVGAVKGAGIGLGVGVLAALASIFIPGVGLVTGGGALATAIGAAAGTTAAGAVAGGTYGYLKDQGVPEATAKVYNQTLEMGGSILAVHVPSNDVDQSTIEGIMEKYGAVSINIFAEGQYLPG